MSAPDGAKRAGREWLHVDVDDELAPIHLDACGSTATRGGLLDLG